MLAPQNHRHMLLCFLLKNNLPYHAPTIIISIINRIILVLCRLVAEIAAQSNPFTINKLMNLRNENVMCGNAIDLLF